MTAARNKNIPNGGGVGWGWVGRRLNKQLGLDDHFKMPSSR